MVDAQTIGVLVTAVSVTVAAIYYMMMLRMNQRTMLNTQTNNLLQSWLSEEGQRSWGELLNMKWTDYDDFERKYGSDNNLDNFAKRQACWYFFDIVGNQMKSGQLDKEIVYKCIGIGAPWTWAKFRAILMENRRRYSGADTYKGFEFLAGEMMRMKLERDPSYKIPDGFAEYIPDN